MHGAARQGKIRWRTRVLLGSSARVKIHGSREENRVIF
jgi:hypothetical protein